MQGATVYAGEVRSRVEQSLGFRIAGKVSERLIDAGAVVRPGQVLARLDPVDTALSAGAADAQRQLAEADAARFRGEGEELRQPGRPRRSGRPVSKAAAAQADLSRNQSAYTVLKADQPGSSGRSWPRSDRLSVPGNRSSASRARIRSRSPSRFRKAVLTRRARRTTPKSRCGRRRYDVSRSSA